MSTSIIFLTIGLLTVLLTLTKPNFYWNSRKARRFRKLIGDTGATIVYFVIGGIIATMGLASILGLISL